MPNYDVDGCEPFIQVTITHAYGVMSNWDFTATPTRMDSLGGNIWIVVREGKTEIRIIEPRGRVSYDTEPIISVKGFLKAMRLLSARYGVKVMVTGSSWSNNERARSLYGIYGEYVPPPPPVVATPVEVSVLRMAHAEYAARVRGEQTGTRLGYCTQTDCGNVAAQMSLIDDKPAAICKAHMTFDPDTLNAIINLVRRNGRVFTAEVKSFGYEPAAFARVARDGYIRLVRESGGMTRWEMAPPERVAEVLFGIPPREIAASPEDSPMFTTNGKRKSTSRNRRYRKGA